MCKRVKDEQCFILQTVILSRKFRLYHRNSYYFREQYISKRFDPGLSVAVKGELYNNY